jgi:hypothetical protein
MKPIIVLAALLTTTWPNGYVQRSPALDIESCIAARDFDLKHGALRAVCEPTTTHSAAGFKPGWNCINGRCKGNGR